MQLDIGDALAAVKDAEKEEAAAKTIQAIYRRFSASGPKLALEKKQKILGSPRDVVKMRAVHQKTRELLAIAREEDAASPKGFQNIAKHLCNAMSKVTWEKKVVKGIKTLFESSQELKQRQELRRGILTARVIAAYALPQVFNRVAQKYTSPNPFVRVSLGPSTFKTSVRDRKINPKWDSTLDTRQFSFIVQAEETHRFLRFEVFSDGDTVSGLEKLNDELLGHTEIDVHSLNWDQWYIERHKLIEANDERGSAELEFQLRFARESVEPPKSSPSKEPRFPVAEGIHTALQQVKKVRAEMGGLKTRDEMERLRRVRTEAAAVEQELQIHILFQREFERGQRRKRDHHDDHQTSVSHLTNWPSAALATLQNGVQSCVDPELRRRSDILEARAAIVVPQSQVCVTTDAKQLLQARRPGIPIQPESETVQAESHVPQFFERPRPKIELETVPDVKQDNANQDEFFSPRHQHPLRDPVVLAKKIRSSDSIQSKYTIKSTESTKAKMESPRRAIAIGDLINGITCETPEMGANEEHGKHVLTDMLIKSPRGGSTQPDGRMKLQTMIKSLGVVSDIREAAFGQADTVRATTKLRTTEDEVVRRGTLGVIMDIDGHGGACISFEGALGDVMVSERDLTDKLTKVSQATNDMPLTATLNRETRGIAIDTRGAPQQSKDKKVKQHPCKTINSLLSSKVTACSRHENTRGIAPRVDDVAVKRGKAPIVDDVANKKGIAPRVDDVGNKRSIASRVDDVANIRNHSKGTSQGVTPAQARRETIILRNERAKDTQRQFEERFPGQSVRNDAVRRLALELPNGDEIQAQVARIEGLCESLFGRVSRVEGIHQERQDSQKACRNILSQTTFNQQNDVSSDDSSTSSDDETDDSLNVDETVLQDALISLQSADSSQGKAVERVGTRDSRMTLASDALDDVRGKLFGKQTSETSSNPKRCKKDLRKLSESELLVVNQLRDLRRSFDAEVIVSTMQKAHTMKLSEKSNHVAGLLAELDWRRNHLSRCPGKKPDMASQRRARERALAANRVARQNYEQEVNSNVRQDGVVEARGVRIFDESDMGLIDVLRDGYSEILELNSEEATESSMAAADMAELHAARQHLNEMLASTQMGSNVADEIIPYDLLEAARTMVGSSTKDHGVGSLTKIIEWVLSTASPDEIMSKSGHGGNFRRFTQYAPRKSFAESRQADGGRRRTIREQRKTIEMRKSIVSRKRSVFEKAKSPRMPDGWRSVRVDQLHDSSSDSPGFEFDESQWNDLGHVNLDGFDCQPWETQAILKQEGWPRSLAPTLRKLGVARKCQDEDSGRAVLHRKTMPGCPVFSSAGSPSQQSFSELPRQQSSGVSSAHGVSRSGHLLSTSGNLHTLVTSPSSALLARDPNFSIKSTGTNPSTRSSNGVLRGISGWIAAADDVKDSEFAAPFNDSPSTWPPPMSLLSTPLKPKSPRELEQASLRDMAITAGRVISSSMLSFPNSALQPLEPITPTPALAERPFTVPTNVGRTRGTEEIGTLSLEVQVVTPPGSRPATQGGCAKRPTLNARSRPTVHPSSGQSIDAAMRALLSRHNALD